MSILVGYNASKESEGAVIEGAVAARARGLTLHLLWCQVHDPGESFTQVERDTHQGVDAMDALEALADTLRAKGVEVRTDLRHGLKSQTADVILDVAEEVGAHMIVLGWRPRSRVTEAVLGGVAREVLRRTTRPVLSVPIEAHDG